MKNRSVKVVHARPPLYALEPKVITFSIAVPFLNPSTSKETGECIWVMIPTRSVPLKEWHPAKFGAPDNQSIFQESTAFHIADKGCGGLIHDLRLHGMGLIDITMRVPVGNSIPSGWVASVKKLNHTDSFFQQATG